MAEAKLTVGNVEIVALDDGAVDFPFPLTQIFPGTTQEAWASYRGRYPEVFAGPDTWRAHWGGYLLRSEGRNILVNTGVGSALSNPGVVNNLNGGVDGRLLHELQAVGVRPEDVDIVFFTHLHPDHVGYNLSQRGPNSKAMFSRARYVVHQADWEAFDSREVQESFSPSAFGRRPLALWQIWVSWTSCQERVL